MNKKEVWVPVEGYPNHELSNLGRVRSLPRQGSKGGLLVLHEHKTYKRTHDKEGGYWGYSLSHKNKKKFYPLHQLMGRHFIPNPLELPCVLHRDDDRKNNSLSNLYWGTKSENSKDLWDNGIRKRTTYTFNLKTVEQVVQDNLSPWFEERGVPIK